MKNQWSSSATCSQDPLHLGILEEIQKFMTKLQFEPEQFKGRIISMSMYNDIVWEERGKKQKNVCLILRKLRIMLAGFYWDVGHFWDFDQRRKDTELVLMNQMQSGTKLLN